MSKHQPTPVRQTLRRATTAAHHELDHHPLLQRLMSSGLTRELYAESLAAMYVPHVRLERQVHESRHHAASGLALAARRRLLEEDLVELGWPVPRVPAVPSDPLGGSAAWWGRLYVLEGSRLGGAVIARHIRLRFGDTVPRRFFDTKPVAVDHDALQAMCQQELEDPDALETAAASAQAAFAAYRADLDAFSASKREAALAACGFLPVHIPGAIQPHGVLVAMDEELQQVRQVSANIETFLGVAVPDALAMTPEQLFSRRWLEQIRAQLHSRDRHGTLIVSLRIRGMARRFRLLLFRSGSRVVAELEPISGNPERWLFGALADWQTALSSYNNPGDLLGALVALVRELAGYERVMVYRFDDDWNGSVIAESLAQDVHSYAGHHFPASDIPVQVRHLYSIMRVRDIPDATATPVPLVQARDGIDEPPLDLSRGILRAAAPIHVRYLANMEVVASMSIALHLDGRLWGLLACHSSSANILPPALRDALRAMVQTACFQLELIQAREDAALIHRANDTRDMLVDQRGQFSDPTEIVERHGPAWLEIFQSGGAVLMAGDRVATIGAVPATDAIRAIVDWLAGHPTGELAWSSRELGRTGLAGLCPPNVAAGLLAVPLPIETPSPAWLMFFRPEKTETRTWAGDPDKAIDAESGELSPRTSFRSWNERVRGKSAPWAPVKLRSAANLARDLAVLIATGQISRLNQQLEQLATTDHLTGLWNRYRMEEAIDHEVSVADRYGRPCALVMFDIDHFKRFNDSWGHAAGDEVLARVTHTVSAKLRQADCCSRWGGEEFIVLAPATTLEAAAQLAERLRAAIDALAGAEHGRVTASFGVAAHRRGESRRDLIKRADLAMYAAKQAGRNRIEISANPTGGDPLE